MNFCPTCGKPVARTARFCTNCGAAVDSLESSANELPEGDSAEVRFLCPYCGTELMGDSREAGATYPCLNCGREVQVPSASTATTQPVSEFSISSVPPTPTGSGRRGRCKYCSHSIPVGTTPCPYCGHELKWPTKIPLPSVRIGSALQPSTGEKIAKAVINGAKESVVDVLNDPLGSLGCAPLGCAPLGCGCLLLIIPLPIPCYIAISKMVGFLF